MRENRYRALKDDVGCILVCGSLVYDNSGIPRITNDGGFTYTTCLKGTEQQFIGLKDEELKDIYEGDRIGGRENGVITYDPMIGGYRVGNHALSVTWIDYDIRECRVPLLCGCKIIHDTPALLTGKGE